MSGVARLRAALRLVARGYAARGAPTAQEPAPRRRQAVERAGIRGDAAEQDRYLAATAGGALRGAATVPPLRSSTWEAALALELLSTLEPPLPLGAVVHAGSEILVARPPRVEEVLRCRVELERVEPARDGVRLEVSARNWAPGGRLCTESKHVFRVRTRRGPAGPRRLDAPIALDGWTRLAEWTLEAGAGRRYARVSGDWNPIHLWPLTARPLGFRRPILHGFCTAAMAAHAVCERLWNGDPAAVRRFRIDFRAPLPLPGRAVLWTLERAGHVDFRVAAPDGTTLYAEGEIGGGG